MNFENQLKFDEVTVITWWITFWDKVYTNCIVVYLVFFVWTGLYCFWCTEVSKLRSCCSIKERLRMN